MGLLDFPAYWLLSEFRYEFPHDIVQGPPATPFHRRCEFLGRQLLPQLVEQPLRFIQLDRWAVDGARATPPPDAER